jgi:hypothetical protein
MSAHFIDDGYTLKAAVPARGPWPALTYTYRPALRAAVMDYAVAKKETGSQRVKAENDLLAGDGKGRAGHVVGWDAPGKDGEPSPVAAERLSAMPDHYVRHMVEHVCGWAELEAADEKN